MTTLATADEMMSALYERGWHIDEIRHDSEDEWAVRVVLLGAYYWAHGASFSEALSSAVSTQQQAFTPIPGVLVR